MKKLALICCLLTLFANPSQAGKKKDKNKGDVDPNAAKIAKCKKEEKKLAKCVSKGTYDVDFEEMGSLYLDFVTKFRKSKEYKKIAKETAAVKKDHVVEDYLSSTEFKTIGELHALEYLDTAAGKEDIAQRLEDEYRPGAEERLLEHDDALNSMSYIALELINSTRAELAVLVADDFALIDHIMSLDEFGMENLEDVDDFIEIARPILDPDMTAVDSDEDNLQYIKDLFLFDSAHLKSSAPNVNPYLRKIPGPQSRGGLPRPFDSPLIQIETSNQKVYDAGPPDKPMNYNPWDMNYSPWDYNNFNYHYQTEPWVPNTIGARGLPGPQRQPMNNPVYNPVYNPMGETGYNTDYPVYNNLPTNIQYAPIQPNPNWYYGPPQTNPAGPPAVEESIEGRNIFDLINPNGFLQPAAPVPVVTDPPEVVDDQWAVHFEVKVNEGDSSEEQEVRESVVDRMKFFMG